MQTQEITAEDQQKNSRSSYVFNIQKVASCKCLIIGLDGLGVEIAKNIILSGCRTIGLYDPENVHVVDLSANFYASEANIGQNRVTTVLPKLIALADDDRVVISQCHSITKEEISKYNVVVVANEHVFSKKVRDWSNWTRELGIGFVVCETRGVAAILYTDPGMPTHKYCTTNGNPFKENIILKVSSSEGKTFVSLEPDHDVNRHSSITFAGMEAPLEFLNGTSHQVSSMEGKAVLSLNLDISSLPGYIGKGYVKKNITFEEQNQPTISELSKDPQEYEHPTVLVCFMALSSFVEKHNCLPGFSDLAEFSTIVQDIACKLEYEMEEEHVKVFVRTCKGKLCPLANFMGGFAAQEVIKLVTNTYQPCKRFMLFEDFACVPHENTAPEEPLHSRYYGQELVFGNKVQQSLASRKEFLVGAGALGCEFIKNMALMGICCSPDGLLVVTDMDAIEVSNLSRQFLFQKDCVTKNKSEVAAMKAAKMNDKLNVVAKMEEVSAGSKSFKAPFWDSISGVTCAVDNLAARKFLLEKARQFTKNMLESGTEGTVGHTNCIIAQKTESMGNFEAVEAQKIPVCTLKQFPYKAYHCVLWAIEMFNDIFLTCKERLMQKKAVDGDNELLCKMYEILQLASSYSIKEKLAKQLAQALLIDTIDAVVSVYPEDHVDENMQKFWTGIKTFPHIPADLLTSKEYADFVATTVKLFDISELQRFDKDIDLHMLWVYSVAVIRARCYKIAVEDLPKVRKMAGNIIPAVVTTTAIITGLVSMNYYKMAQNLPPSAYKNYNVNTASNFFEWVYSRTLKSDTYWQSNIFKANPQHTVHDFVAHVSQVSGKTIEEVTVNGKKVTKKLQQVLSSFIPSDESDAMVYFENENGEPWIIVRSE